MPQTPDDHAFENRTSRVLISGVALAAGVVALGSAAYLALHHGAAPNLSTYHPTPTHLHTFGPLLARAAHLDPLALMQVGVILLILTPVLRVAFTLLAFLRRRDRVFILINAFVLAALLYGLAGGRV